MKNTLGVLRTPIKWAGNILLGAALAAAAAIGVNHRDHASRMEAARAEAAQTADRLDAAITLTLIGGDTMSDIAAARALSLAAAEAGLVIEAIASERQVAARARPIIGATPWAEPGAGAAADAALAAAAVGAPALAPEVAIEQAARHGGPRAWLSWRNARGQRWAARLNLTEHRIAIATPQPPGAYAAWGTVERALRGGIGRVDAPLRATQGGWVYAQPVPLPGPLAHFSSTAGRLWIAAATLAMLAFAIAARRQSTNVAALEENAALQAELTAAEESVTRTERRYRQLIEAADLVAWSADLDAQTFLDVDPQIEALAGYPAENWLGRGFWAQHIHPEDRARVLAELPAAIEAGHATFSYRIRAADGRVRHVRNALRVERYGERLLAEGFLRDLTAAQALEDQLQAALRQVDHAERLKSEFASNISHELRTPLNAIIGCSDVMKTEMLGALSADYKQYAESIHDSGKQLLEMINDIIDLSTITVGRAELLEQESNLDNMMTECVDAFRNRASEAGLRLSLEMSIGATRAMVDDRRLRRVLSHLLDNGVKFTPPGGAVVVRAEHRLESGLLLSVTDTGIGMSEAEIPQALTSFIQLDGARTRRREGAGVGLPLAKAVIELHGGALEIRSEKGRGSEVRLWIPEERVVRAAA